MTANRERPRLTAAPSKDLYPKTKGNAPNLERPIRGIGRWGTRTPDFLRV